MTITLQLGPHAQAELLRQAHLQGRGIEEQAAVLLEEALNPIDCGPRDRDKALAAAARIRELREHITLGGLSVRDLIDEGRA